MNTRTNHDKIKEEFIHEALKIIRLHESRSKHLPTKSRLKEIIKMGNLVKEWNPTIYQDKKGELFCTQTAVFNKDSKAFTKHKADFMKIKYIKPCNQI